MPLRAFRLLTFPNTSEASYATSLSFALTLQLAAGHAWSRRVIAHSPLETIGKRHFRSHAPIREMKKSKPCQADSVTHMQGCNSSLGASVTRSVQRVQTVKRPKLKEPHKPSSQSIPKPKAKPSLSKLIYIEPTAWDFESYHPGSSDSDVTEDDFFHDVPSHLLPQAQYLNPAAAISSKLFLPPTPRTRTALHRNLLYLIDMQKPIPKLPVLLDYHDLYPSLQSTPTFNILINLALRHRSYGIVRRLLLIMKTNLIPKNMETYKLEVRYLINQGRWAQAWDYINTLKKQKVFLKDEKGRLEIPYQIWLEFCRPSRSRSVKRQVFNEDGELVKTYFERYTEGSETFQHRQKLLTQNQPISTMPTLSNTAPFAAYCLTKLLILSGNYDSALSLTKAYFRSIPRYMNLKNALRCLDIIHLHMVSSTAKNGLPRFYDMRKRLFSLLKLHPGIRPNSRTLYLLLGPVIRAKHAGSIAWNVLLSFRKNWGYRIEDRRVQRRVIQCALKEGRLDIVSRVSKAERQDRVHRKRTLAEEDMGYRTKRIRSRWRLHFPLRNIYPKNGREARLWLRLRGRIRRKTKLLHQKRYSQPNPVTQRG